MKRRIRPSHDAGITLIELMIVVAIIAILAVIGVVGYSRYIKSARLIEARDVIGKIQLAQESYYQRTGNYCDATGGAWQPASVWAGFETRPWGTPVANWTACFGMKAQPERNQTYFSYQVVAGSGSNATTTALGIQGTMPWYYVLAQADMDGNGATPPTEFRVHSEKREIWVLNEGQ